MLAAPSPGKHHLVHFPYQPVGKRETFPESHNPVLRRSNVAGDFYDVIKRRARGFFDLEEQQVRQRGLSPFDLRRKNSLSPYVGVEEEIRVRKQEGDAVQSSKRERRAFQLALVGTREINWRSWRQWIWDEGANFLAAGDADVVSACAASPHLISLPYSTLFA